MATTRESIGQRSETIRRANLSSIANELHLRGPVSRSELGSRTGLTRSAIRALLGELVEAGLAREDPPLPLGVPGRPSPIVSPVASGLVALGLDVAVDSLAAALLGFGGTLVEHVRVDRPRRHSSVDATVADLTDLALPLLRRIGDRSRLAGVGVAIVGVVRRDDGVVAVAPNLGWRDVPLGQRLTTALDLGIPISVANEADLGALAEARRGAARGVHDVVFISGEVGVGGGVISGGRPLTGAAGYAGEVGHVVVNPDGVACRCGSVGCWETEIGEGPLLARAGLPPAGGRPAIDQLLAAATEGAPAALLALDEVGTWLGLGLAGLVNLFNPSLVVLGGLFGRIEPFVGRTVGDQLERRALAAPRAGVRVVPAALGLDAALIGAAEAAFDPFLADPAARLARRGPVPARSRMARGAGEGLPEGISLTKPRGGAIHGPARQGKMRREIPEGRKPPRGSARSLAAAHPDAGEGGRA